MTTTLLQLPTVPPAATKAREVLSFHVDEDLLRRARSMPTRFPQGLAGEHLPEAQLRALGHSIAEAKREQFRVSAHPDLPDAWVRSEVELVISGAWDSVTVLVALLVEPPELCGVWEVSPGSAPTLADQPTMNSETALVGYCTVDGREVYGPRP